MQTQDYRDCHKDSDVWSDLYCCTVGPFRSAHNQNVRMQFSSHYLASTYCVI